MLQGEMQTRLDFGECQLQVVCPNNERCVSVEYQFRIREFGLQGAYQRPNLFFVEIGEDTFGQEEERAWTMLAHQLLPGRVEDRDWFALSGRRLHHYTVANPFLQDPYPGGRVLFLPLYSRPLALFPSFKTILRSPYFSHFPTLHSLFGPWFPFCSDLVRFASGKLYPCPARAYGKSPFWVVVLSLRPVLQPDLFFEPPER